MKLVTRTAFAAILLTAFMANANAQTEQEHQAHHPTDQGTTQAPPSPSPEAPAPGMRGQGMMGQGMPMRSMMGGDMGQMMGRPEMGGPDRPMGMMPFEHVEGRIAFLKAELGITPAQEAQWNAFADAIRKSAAAHKAMHDRMQGMRSGAPSTWPERLRGQREMLAARLDAVAALEAAAAPLYSALSEEQKTRADRLLSGPMGMM